MGAGRLQTIKTWREAAGSATSARWLVLAAFAVVSGAAVLQPTQASAACAPGAGSNITVTCSGATLNQGPGINTGYGDSTQNGLTVNIQSGGSVLGTSTGIDVNNNNTINNLGTISTNGSGGIGNVYGINANGPLTLNNSGTIGRVDLNNLTNTDSAGVYEGGSLVLTNNSGGVIQGSMAVEAAGTPNTMTVTNSGLISGIVGGGGMGISGDSVTVTNKASGTISGDSFGINAGTATVFNYGTISSPGFGGTAVSANTLTLTNYASGIITADSVGISGSQTPTLTVTNFGTISATGSDATNAISGNVVKVTNSGTISVAIGPGGTAISMASGSIINSAGGSIVGDHEAIGASGNTTIFNAGTISANSGPAIFFASGGNTLTLGPGSVITGAVKGAGSDTFQLGGTGSDTFNASNIGTQYTGFTTFNKIDTSTWTLTGTPTIVTPWTISGGTLVAAHQTAGIIDALSGGDITMNGGTLRTTVSGTYKNNLIFNANTSSTVSVAAGQTVTFGSNGGAAFTTFGANSTATFGSPTYTGTIVIASTLFPTADPTANVVVAGGTLRDGNGSLGDAMGNMLSTTVNAGATLDLNDQADVVNNLKGAGLVLTGTSAATTLVLLTGNNATNAPTTSLFSGVIAGPAGVQVGATGAGVGGVMILAGNNTYTGGTLIQSAESSNETLQLGNGGASGSILGNVVFQAPGGNGPDPGILVFDRSDTYTFAGAISGPGSLVQAGPGTTILTNTNTYSGATTVNGGTLEVDGSITASSSVTVNTGGTLSGTGSLDPSTITIATGGTLTPGNATNPKGTLAITGDLVFNSGSYYAVQIAPGAGNNSKTAVIGSADLGGNGTVIVTPTGLGRYATVYQILTTTAGLTGSFAGLTVNGDFTGMMRLDYTTNPGDVDLDVFGAILFATPSGANQSQQNVLNGINNAILGGYILPPSFASLGNISGPVLLDALTQLSGEAATGAERSAFQLMTEFLGLMLDPFVNGRSGGFASSAISFAPDEQESLPPDIALAYASVLKAPPKPSFDQRWTAWGSAYGGSSSTNGDPAAGSNNVTTQTYGFAGGMDYHVSPFTVAGFALAGAGTNWGLANALGSGRGDAFQFGAYSITWFGPAYLAGALAFTNHWFTTNRSALGDQLTANFDGQSYGARFEGGYRYALLPTLGVTPYAALQVQDFQTPSYSESDVTGGGFGLSYAAMNATDVRSELGARFDDPTLLGGMPLILRGRLAWAHDWVSNPSLSAAFESLPGSSFTVNGAPIPQDSALASAGAQLFFTANWSLLAKFDGEFASGSQTYGGSGTLRYTW
jgi:autotransporter-associated beta strand protein